MMVIPTLQAPMLMGGDVLWLLEKCKKALLEVSDND